MMLSLPLSHYASSSCMSWSPFFSSFINPSDCIPYTASPCLITFILHSPFILCISLSCHSIGGPHVHTLLRIACFRRCALDPSSDSSICHDPHLFESTTVMTCHLHQPLSGSHQRARTCLRCFTCGIALFNISSQLGMTFCPHLIWHWLGLL